MICGIRHPLYAYRQNDWLKWRRVYDGGDDFVHSYLEKYSERETTPEFEARKRITPRPNFAKAAVNDIKNSIFQRLADVNRRGGSKRYQEAARGDIFGVDLHGASMNSFVGREVLSELLIMAKVGVFVDMPRIPGPTLRDAVGKRPYIYKYRVEDICSWTYHRDNPDEYSSVLLRDYIEEHDGQLGLPCGTKCLYRHCFLEDGVCKVRFYKELPATHDASGNIQRHDAQVNMYGEPEMVDYALDIPYIPFTTIEISDSLLADIANHQIALLNMESSDVNYSLRANFPFYTEQKDNRPGSNHLQGPEDDDGRTIEVGVTKGRSYGLGTDRPGFIHPSAEPLKASMEKQQQLKDDIRGLVNLTLSNVKPKFSSAESKEVDERGVDAGLSGIGLVLEHAERKIAFYWHALEKSRETATIKYPEKWRLKSDADRREDAKSLKELRGTIPSAEFQRAISKEIARLLLENKVEHAVLEKVLKEIDDAEIFTAEPETLREMIDAGVVPLRIVAKVLGLPESAVKEAAEDHADRLERILKSQQKADASNENPAARGVKDLDANPNSGSAERAASRDTTTKESVSDPVRGKADEDAKL